MSSERYTCLGIDIDGTLIAEERDTAHHIGDAALKILCDVVVAGRSHHPQNHLFVGPVTGRTLASQRALMERHAAFKNATAIMNFSVGAVGTEVAFKNNDGFVQDANWPKAHNWNRSKLQEYLLAGRPELRLQGELAKGDHKLSFYIDSQTMGRESYLAELRTTLEQGGWAAGLVLSGDIYTQSYLDLLPVDEAGHTIHKGKGFLHVAHTLAARHDIDPQAMRLALAGDGFNDCDGFLEVCAAGGVSIIPANASPEMKEWAHDNLPEDQLYIAPYAPYAAGVLEGVYHFELL